MSAPRVAAQVKRQQQWLEQPRPQRQGDDDGPLDRLRGGSALTMAIPLNKPNLLHALGLRGVGACQMAEQRASPNAQCIGIRHIRCRAVAQVHPQLEWNALQKVLVHQHFSQNFSRHCDEHGTNLLHPRTVALMKAEPGWIGTSTNEARRLRSATHRPKQAYAVQPPLMLQVLGAQAAWTRMQYAYLHVQHARVPLESRWSRQWISACTL